LILRRPCIWVYSILGAKHILEGFFQGLRAGIAYLEHLNGIVAFGLLIELLDHLANELQEVFALGADDDGVGDRVDTKAQFS